MGGSGFRLLGSPESYIRLRAPLGYSADKGDLVSRRMISTLKGYIYIYYRIIIRSSK